MRVVKLLALFVSASAAIAANAAEDGLEVVVPGYTATLGDQERLELLWDVAADYRAQGRNRLALRLLNESTSLVGSSPGLSAELGLRSADVYLGLGRFEQSREVLGQVDVDMLGPSSRVVALTLEGQLAVHDADYRRAREYYEDAAEVAKSNGLQFLEVEARLNALRTRYDDKNPIGITRGLDALVELVEALPLSSKKAVYLVNLGNLYQQGVDEFEFERRYTESALAAFQRATINEPSAETEAYAFGLIGAIHESEGRIADAMAATNKALFLAQAVRSDEQIYRWEWQMARLYKAQGRTEEAAGSYARSLASLREIKSGFALGSQKVFAEQVAPVYEQYADVLLVNSSKLSVGEQKSQALADVIALLEELKQAELEDYFEDTCVVEDSDQQGALFLDSSAAIIYPVFLDGRVETIVRIGSEHYQFSAPVDANAAERSVRRLRLNLENPQSDDYLQYAKEVYDWLIKPMESQLLVSEIETIVSVPSGALRTIPIAALHDGEKYLVENYAVATTPAINLTASGLDIDANQLLLGGISVGIGEFSPLPAVPNELNTISERFGGRDEVLLNDLFKLDRVVDELGSDIYKGAHFATHGEFSKNYNDSFILAFDGKLTMDMLRAALESRQELGALDLLVLSACQTAAGDDRAALGLAGVAVQSGARSAVASLWYVSDVATAELVNSFYASLDGASKAQSLRQAQLNLLRNEQFSHPSYWAPYLLVGNWM